MRIDSKRLWEAVRLGEDSDLELKAVDFRGKKVVAPARDDLADELAAFANARGGCLMLGVRDDRTPQSLDPAQLDALMDLVKEICEDSIKPRLNFDAIRIQVPALDEGGALAIEIPQGDVVHRSPNGYYSRRGDAKREMQPDDIRRLLQARGQSDAAAPDTQTVAGTSFNTLQPDLWRRYASSRAGESPEIALSKLKFAKADGQGVLRTTVGGLLLGCEEPRDWLPNAYIQAVCYGGQRMDGNRQLDAQDIGGPLNEQIRDAMRFVLRNRRVAARKAPGRCDVPQYSERALFEALVNAVVHRDYAVAGAHIRLFMFDDRLELYSPGSLCNSMTTDDLRTSQFTRNELLASRLGQCPVGDIPGAGDRQYFIERRGEGVSVIEDETFALVGKKPVFEMLGGRELRLTLPAASPPPPNGIAIRVAAVDDRNGKPLRDAHVLVLYPNKTYLEARTDAFGHAEFTLHSKLPVTVLCAAPGFVASIARDHAPDGVLEQRMAPLAGGGSLIIANRTGHLPGIEGRLNPILDHLDRTYLYADNVAVNDGLQQPVHFALNDPVRLTDALGTSATLWFREALGASWVFDYSFENA